MCAYLIISFLQPLRWITLTEPVWQHTCIQRSSSPSTCTHACARSIVRPRFVSAANLAPVNRLKAQKAGVWWESRAIGHSTASFSRRSCDAGEDKTSPLQWPFSGWGRIRGCQALEPVCGYVTAAFSPPLCQADRRRLSRHQSIAAFIRSNTQKRIWANNRIDETVATLMTWFRGNNAAWYSQ